MTPETTDVDDDDFDFPPLTLKDWIGFLDDDIDEAAETLKSEDIDKLVEYLRKKADDLDTPF